ncbi:hypothetical protein L1987_11024 [Smallanthus sonchifolius]|uniref:Uncharacterized protein n=1 Tax=Smallanthus sonchifolius TaxID=185202 RepID=A0ACB9JCE6_9ASTR|nr:hypothetical protein L1987_11024 [Smallanthus sonchifolius]
MWTGLWSSTIQKNWNSNLHCYFLTLAIFWTYTGSLLILIGQNPSISHEAGKYITWLIPALFAYAILQPLILYFQMQSMLLPMLASSTVALCLHIPLCWSLVHKTVLGNIGAAISMGWSNAIFLLFYMKYSSSCANTRSPISLEVFRGTKQFFSFAIPSAVMICLELWSYELLVLLSGLLPNPELETSVLADLLCVETAIVSTSVFASRRAFGYIFTNEKEVVDYVTRMVPFLCLNIIMDSIQGTLSGVARGVGWQHLGAYANLAAFYLVGIPVAALLGFCTSLRGEGLWIGILIGATVLVILLSVVTVFTNYEKQVTSLVNVYARQGRGYSRENVQQTIDRYGVELKTRACVRLFLDIFYAK